MTRVTLLPLDPLSGAADGVGLTPYGRQEEWEDSPEGWPQTPPYQWWQRRDEYDGGKQEG